jgi:hypothetical protein
MTLIDTPKGKKHLIVMVPDGLAGNLDLAQKIYWLAARSGWEVIYLALVDDEDETLTITRHMATMKAVTAGNALVVHSVVTGTAHWLKTLREIYRPGDRIVCHAEQSVKNGFLKTQPIAEFLPEVLATNVITISGFYHPQQIQMRRWFHALVTWLGFLAILAIFTLLEIKLDPVFHGFAGKLLLGAIFTVEVGSIWAWNNISGQMR